MSFGGVSLSNLSGGGRRSWQEELLVYRIGKRKERKAWATTQDCRGFMNVLARVLGKLLAKDTHWKSVLLGSQAPGLFSHLGTCVLFDCALHRRNFLKE